MAKEGPGWVACTFMAVAGITALSTVLAFPVGIFDGIQAAARTKKRCDSFTNHAVTWKFMGVVSAPLEALNDHPGQGPLMILESPVLLPAMSGIAGSSAGALLTYKVSGSGEPPCDQGPK